MRIFLDSCVILSRLPRALFLDLAKNKHLEISYSQTVEDEVMHVAARKSMEADMAAAFVELRLCAQKVESFEDHAGLWLPDEHDRHVVLGALKAGAEIIATENLRDFPKSALEPLGLEARNPDQILTELAKNGQIKICSYEPKLLKNAKLYRLSKLAKNQLDQSGNNQP